jgi:hypothetical protein
MEEWSYMMEVSGSLTLRPLYSKRKGHQYPLYREIDGHQSGSGAENICYTFTESNLDSMVV